MPKGISISGKIVRELRQKLHLSQPTLAKKIGASVETVKRIEKTDVVDVGIELVPRIAAALNTTTEAIEIKEDDEASPVELPAWASQFKTLAEAQDAIQKAWDSENVRKAALKRKK